MDQNPLPRGSLQICDRTGEELRTVPELAQTAVAVEAQYPAHPSGPMIVIYVLGVGHTTDGTHAALLGQEGIDLELTDAVAPPQVILPAAAVQPQPRFLAAGICGTACSTALDRRCRRGYSGSRRAP
jgi:hypothetical protein